MKRSEFLKLLGLGTLGLSLPFRAKAQTPLRRRRVVLYDGFIRGVRYYDYARVKETLRPGQKLLLKREPENTYDNMAIALYAGKAKLGYVPAEDNLILARMLDAGLPLQARILAHPGETYYEVQFQISMTAVGGKTSSGTKLREPGGLYREAPFGIEATETEAWPRIEDEPPFPYC